jgi:hypothetical protein
MLPSGSKRNFDPTRVLVLKQSHEHGRNILMLQVRHPNVNSQISD